MTIRIELFNLKEKPPFHVRYRIRSILFIGQLLKLIRNRIPAASQRALAKLFIRP